MSERHIELQWRCSSCSHKNLGRHMTCQGCGNPKDDSEEYEMPADPSTVASVDDDPNLLRMAKAGENWKCEYCGSGQRDLDGGCAQCGAGRKEGANANPRRAVPSAVNLHAQPAKYKRFSPAHYVLAAIVGVSILFAACLVVGGRKKATTNDNPAFAPPTAVAAVKAPTDFEAKVIGSGWSRTIRVEKWQLVPHEDFTAVIPTGAVDVRAAGQHLHHNEDVYDHDETVYDNVEVPDGYRTETYSERVRCGEDCTTSTRTCRRSCTRTARTCRQVCTNKKNGFASCRDDCSGGNEICHDECTGGDRKCTPKYCNESRTRQIPKTRIEKRARVEKKYRSEPRFAAWSTYKTWEWVEIRKADDSADNTTASWPDAGSLQFDIADAGTFGGTLKDGGIRANAEREIKTESFHARLRGLATNTEHSYVPRSEAELARLTTGAVVMVHVENGVVRLESIAGEPVPRDEE